MQPVASKGAADLAYYDGAGRMVCQDLSYGDVVNFFRYDGSGHRLEKYWGFSRSFACSSVIQDYEIIGGHSKKSTYTYDGNCIVSEQTMNGGGVYYTRSYTYDAEGNLTQVTHTDYSDKSGVYVLTYTWEPGTHRMTGLTRTENGTLVYRANIEYDRLGRITRICENGATSCPTYAYIGDSDWLSAVSGGGGAIYDRYQYADGRPLRLDTGGTSYYYRYNARGDAVAVAAGLQVTSYRVTAFNFQPRTVLNHLERR